MMKALSPFAILNSLGLLSWKTLLVGWKRGWVTNANLDDFAVIQLQSDVSDPDLAAIATLASTDQLCTPEIDALLKHLSDRETESDGTTNDKWRLAWLLKLQTEQLD